MKLNRFIVLLCCSVIVLSVFVAADFNFSKQLVIETDFILAKPYVGMLYPPVNVNKNLIAAMPVYFKVHLPNYYDRVRVELEYETQPSAAVGIGIVTGPEVNFTEISDNNTVLELPKSVELKFALATEENLAQPVIIKNLKLSFERDKQNFREYLKLWISGIQRLL